MAQPCLAAANVVVLIADPVVLRKFVDRVRATSG